MIPLYTHTMHGIVEQKRPKVAPTEYTGSYSGTLTARATRNNCPPNHTTEEVTYTKNISATVKSTVSQAEANRLAREKAEADGRKTLVSEAQDYANQHGVCTPIVHTATYTGELTATASRNNCPPNHSTRPVQYRKPIQATETSTVSYQDALNKAQERARREGRATLQQEAQEYANQQGVCTPLVTEYHAVYNGTLSGSFSRNNCPPNHTTSPVQYSKAISATATSTVSQQHAEQLAEQKARAENQQAFQYEGQNYANTVGVCTPPPQTEFRKVVVGLDWGRTGGNLTRNVQAMRVTSQAGGIPHYYPTGTTFTTSARTDVIYTSPKTADVIRVQALVGGLRPRYEIEVEPVRGISQRARYEGPVDVVAGQGVNFHIFNDSSGRLTIITNVS